MFPFYKGKYGNLSILSETFNGMETIGHWNTALERQNACLIDRLLTQGRLGLEMDTENIRLKNEIYRLNGIIERLKAENQVANDRACGLFRECHNRTRALVEVIGENMESVKEIERLKFDLSLRD